MILEHSDITGAIIGAGICVQEALGPGQRASTYRDALSMELEHCGLAFETSVPVTVGYKDVEIGVKTVELVVEELITVTVLAVAGIRGAHYAAARMDLHALGLDHGLLLDFADFPLGIRRVGRRPPVKSASSQPMVREWHQA